MNLAELLEKSLDELQLVLIRRMAGVASPFGFSIYLVGGSVRDLLLGRPLNDLDLTVEGDAIALARSLVKKYGGNLTTHDKFHTARWELPNAKNDFIDLISARNETYSHSGALPTVQKSTIDDDLRRRDFTINAMAIRLDGEHFGELFDPLGGQKDLENKLIRVLHPKSFVDDPTRMFRAVRHAGRHGFEIESGTLSLINDEAREILSGLSGERLRHEIDLIFEEPNPSPIMKQLITLDLLKPVHPVLTTTRQQLPTITKPGPDFGEFAIPDMFSFHQTLGWTLYLMDFTGLDIESLAVRLAFPTLLTKAVISASALKKDLQSFKDWKPSQWTFHLDELPSLSVYAVYLSSREGVLEEYLAKWQPLKPHTTGADLKKRGLDPGPRFGEILRRLRAAWLDGEVNTDEEERLLLEKLII